MRIRRTIIIPAILALSAAGSILAGSAVPAVAAQASTAHVLASSAIPSTHYWGCAYPAHRRRLFPVHAMRGRRYGDYRHARKS